MKTFAKAKCTSMDFLPDDTALNRVQAVYRTVSTPINRLLNGYAILHTSDGYQRVECSSVKVTLSSVEFEFDAGDILRPVSVSKMTVFIECGDCLGSTDIKETWFMPNYGTTANFSYKMNLGI